MTAPITFSVDLTAVHARFNTLEILMATVTEALTALQAQSDANHAAVADLVADVRALIAFLRERPLTDAEQALVDSISAQLADEASVVGALDAEVGDADGSDTPAEPPAEG